MPIYEYRCTACGKELEALQKLSDAPLETCPACHADTLVKRVSAAGFQLKGSGWYATDFKGSGKPAAAKKDGPEQPAESKGDGKSETKTETASEAKSETKSEAKRESTSATSSSGTGSSATSS
ncbi:MAG TPA: zinc ribbon domain-containing protein [Candidatus Solibacter sp.]|nr:zinc ribbon domain-containing protein [Candidatus Solibacter sp.]